MGEPLALNSCFLVSGCPWTFATESMTVPGHEHADSVSTVVTFMYLTEAFGFLPLGFLPDIQRNKVTGSFCGQIGRFLPGIRLLRSQA